MKIQENREKWIRALYKLRLQTLTAAFLEALGPVNLVGAQLVYLSQPILSPFISQEQSQDFARILEDPSETEIFVKALRDYEPSTLREG
ncbi:MAG TPA: hypothetical protein ENG59_06530 [Chloroflexi bacterium]|nr:MAG: hypothetical protein DRI46_10160 [Chloroflexota bacterium]HDD55880.1 hypothetical protein [Chloroflexota bacterium]